MPEICRFYGMIIKMFHADHNPPHFHTEYGEHRAVISIRNMALLAGRLPPRAMSLVVEWATIHQAELLEQWSSAKDLRPLSRIAPLE